MIIKKGRKTGKQFQIVRETFLGKISERTFQARTVIWIDIRGSADSLPLSEIGPFHRNQTRPGCDPLPTDVLARFRIEERTEQGWKRVKTIKYTKASCPRKKKKKKTKKPKTKK